LKIGYAFPKKVYKSFGLQLSGVEQNFINEYGTNYYNGVQRSFYGNLIYQSIIGTSDHKFRTGLSSQYDYMDESLSNRSNYSFVRTEVVSGGFFEYTYTASDRFTAVGGFRADYNNMFGMFYTPRLHIRYVLAKKTVLRISAGTGQRTANIIAENTGLLVSSRVWDFMGKTGSYAYGFKPERAVNYGFNLTHDFKLNYRPGTFTMDYYFTDFIHQVVVDRDFDSKKVLFYSLNGKSYSGSFQVQLDYEPVRRLDVRLAYRYYDVNTQYLGGLRQVPLIAKQRGFVNIAYQTKSKWSFDATWQINGIKRLPSTINNPADKQMAAYSESFSIVNLQVTKSIKKIQLDVYGGVENVFNFMQMNPIVDSQNPFSRYFDASMIWGPVFGRMWYGGIRYKI
jgi:outer membrane receptor for ferrienterochelin and colicin